MPNNSSKRILIQYASGPEYEQLLSLTSAIHARYCLRHDICHRIDHAPAGLGRSPHWRKVNC